MSEEEQIPDPHDIIQMLEYEIADKDHRIEELELMCKALANDCERFQRDITKRDNRIESERLYYE